MTIDELKQRSDVFVVIADEDGTITYVHAASPDLLGWEPEDLVGNSLTTLIPPHLHDAHTMGFSRFLTTGRATLMNRPLRLDVLTKDGRTVASEHVIVAERAGDRWVFGATIQPLAPAPDPEQ